VLAGAEIHRFGLQDELLRLVERLNVPVASTLLGKSVIREDHPLYAGVYSGLLGRDETQRLVNEADCLLLLGTILTDIDLGAYSPLVSPGRAVHATADKIAIKRHRYDNIRFEDFVTALADAPLPTFSRRSGASPSPPSLGGEAAGVTERQSAPRAFRKANLPSRQTWGGWGGQNAPATLRGLFDLVDRLITDDILVIADVGESLFAGADLHVRASAEFLSPAYYTSMGFAVPAAVGAGFAAPHRRPLVFVGDGAFQMTGTELATCVRHGQTPIIVVLNNRGYGTEREILEGPFNDIHEWQYEKVCELVGGGIAHRVATHGEAQAALEQALADRANLHVLNVLLDPSDRSPAMVRVARRLAERLSPPKATA
jgi:indolepyruvate decarboxylase